MEHLADSIVRAFNMPGYRQRRWMRSLRKTISRRDIFWWLDNFLRAASGKAFLDFPESELAPVRPSRLPRSAQ
ncbi:MAG: hypothetical protein K9L28_09570 [Synergistales bacterium]|nr:hypothetical protein [Synergistales bacterium]